MLLLLALILLCILLLALGYLYLKGTVYAVGPAHVLFCAEANEKYQTEKCNIDMIREAISERPQTYTTTLEFPNFDTDSEPSDKPDPISTHCPLLLAYRYSYERTSEQAEECRLFMNDTVFFPFDFAKSNKLQKDLNSYNLYRQNKLKSFSRCELQQCHIKRQRVAVRDLTGRLEPYNFNECIRKNRGLKLQFKLDNSEDDL